MEANKKTVDRLFKEKITRYEHNEEMNTAWFLLLKGMEEKRKKKRIFYLRLFSFLLGGLGIGLFWWQAGMIASQGDTLLSDSSATHKKNAAYEESSRSMQISAEKKSERESWSYVQQTFRSAYKENVTYQEAPELTTSSHSVLSAVHEEGEEENSGFRATSEQSDYIHSYAHTYYSTSQSETKPIQVQVYPSIEEINSPYPDYAPVINADGTELYFTSRRPVKTKKGKMITKESIYCSRKDRGTGKWMEPLLVPYPVNQDEVFASAVGISNDGQQLFIYQDNEKGDGNIFVSTLIGDRWSTPEKLPYPVNTEYLETTVSLSPDGNTLFIVSNRPGGYGGLDIWYAVKNKEGQWSEPKNMGPRINTAKNEEGVYAHPDGKTIYFHSDGHKGLGGYDIYYSVYENGGWSDPVNLGSPVNGPEHDVYFVIDAEKRIGYYASKRQNGKGETDIYMVEFSYPDKSKSAAALTLFKGKVLDRNTLEPLEATIEIADIDKNENICLLKSNAATGGFMMSLPAGRNYAITIDKSGYLFYSESFRLDSVRTYNEVEKVIMLDKLRTGARVVLNNIFYDYNQSTLREESRTELDRVYKLMRDNPAIKIELSAHTDSRGSDAYNNKLSQERAQSCVDYLIKKGIDKSRIIAKGYGKQQPVIDDETINKMNSEAEKEAAHQQNRRTEIKIIEN